MSGSTVERTFDPTPLCSGGAGSRHSPVLKNMSVDHRRSDIFVTEEFLDGAYTCPEPQVLGVITVLEQMRGKTMAECVAQREMSLVY